LSFSVLGPVRVERDGESIAVGGLQQRALLAVLLIHHDRVLSTDALVEALYDDAGPEAGLKRLQVSISRLRRVLETDGDEPPIRTEANGYRLALQAGDLDALRYEAALTEARGLLERGQPATAVETLDGALALWRGRALADVEFRSFAQAEVARLEELRLTGLELRGDAMLALARHDAVLPELEALVREHPLRARLRAQLMLALYRAGRQTDALDAYRDGRRRLAEELGLQPGPELRRLEQAILEQAPELEPQQRPDASPNPLPPVIAQLT
jgi:DNA-binding SARP family transcriptional activator